MFLILSIVIQTVSAIYQSNLEMLSRKLARGMTHIIHKDLHLIFRSAYTKRGQKGQSMFLLAMITQKNHK